MNKYFMTKFSIIILNLLFVVSLYAQDTTVTLYPGKDSFVSSLDRSSLGGLDESTHNYGNSTVIRDDRWTWSFWYSRRSLIEFDLSSIPSDAVITEATLTLYGTAHYPLQRSNESCLCRITESWYEDTVTWDNQPTYTTEDSLYLSESSSSTQNYDIDVKDFVQGWIDGYNNNNGLLLRLIDESTNQYTRMVFASSDYTSDTTKRPKLVVKYVTPYKITIKANKDARISSANATTNYGDDEYFQSLGWLPKSGWYTDRSLLEFDLSSIPDDAVIGKAILKLYGVNHDPAQRSNESYLYRVTEHWAEDTVTWNNQPTYTTTDSIYLPESDSSTQNYNVNLKDFVEQWHNDTANYGLMIKLADESTQQNTKMVFASSDYTTDTTKYPVLEVYVYPLSADFDLHSVTRDSMGYISMSGLNGQPPYTYSWNNGSEYNPNYNLEAGL